MASSAQSFAGNPNASVDLRALKAIGGDYPQARGYLLYRGRDRLKLDDILCLPCNELLTNLVPGKFSE